MQTHVRKATLDDYIALCALFAEVDALHRDHLPQIFQQPKGPPCEKEYFANLIADGNVALLVAELEGRLVGCVHAYLKEAPALPILLPRRYAVVDEVVVQPDFRNRGIGRRLMDAAQAWAIEHRATSIELNVYEFNENAISFYASLGYHAFSRKMRKDLAQHDTDG